MADTYLDACCFIYLLEGTPDWRAAVEAQLRHFPNAKFASSRLSRLECRSKPLREGNQALVTQYDALFSPDSVRLVDVGAEVIERATDLRARFNLKSPDALHLATALQIQASAFVTGDATLARCSDVNVVVVVAARP